MVNGKKELRLKVDLAMEAKLLKYKEQNGLQKLRDWCLNDEAEAAS